MIKAIIFDMDGTILNTIDDLTTSVNYALNKYDLTSKTVSEVKLGVGNGAKVLIKRMLDGGEKHPLFEQVYQTYLTHYDAHRMVKTAPYPNILALLRQLKYDGYKLAVVSNKHDYLVKALNKDLFEDLFLEAIGETKERPLKPSPDVIFDVIRMLDVKITEVIFVGDSNVDIMTAKNAHMTSVGVTWGFRGFEELSSEGANYIIEEPFQLFDILKEIG